MKNCAGPRRSWKLRGPAILISQYGAVGYITLSEKGLIKEANLTVATMLGVERSELVNQPLSRFILPEDQDLYYLHQNRLLEAPRPAQDKPVQRRCGKCG